MNMGTSTLQFLSSVNDHYANLLLTIIACVSAVIAYREYLLRRRPYVLPEIVFEKQDNDWFFHIMLVNRGEYPAMVQVSKAVLKIGDEEYPTIFKSEIILAPNAREKLAPIGHINQNGREKIKANKYEKNRVEISTCLKSKSLSGRRFKYQTEVKYQVDVSGENPVITVISEKII